VSDALVIIHQYYYFAWSVRYIILRIRLHEALGVVLARVMWERLVLRRLVFVIFLLSGPQSGLLRSSVF
jgi:hypothetical protein